MNSQSQQAKDIFVELIGNVPPEEWEVRLVEASGGDQELLIRVRALLRAHAEPGSFLEEPAVANQPDPTIDQPITEKPGTLIGPYKLLQQLGEGGMGVVYMAEQKKPVKRRVALKIIKPGMDTRQVIARFEAERQALAMMDHPNIAKVLDAGQTESGRPYFVMELVNGISVTKYCDQQHLTPKERLELFVPICHAVQHAHQKGIIHRDLKPSNILVALYDGQAVPKVIDFGVAKATSQTLTEKTMFTQLGQVVGTLEYMSPEQAERNQLDIDTRSDIYSLGVVLYELLTGETPFDRTRLRSAAFDEMLRIIREEEPSKPSTKVSSSLSLPSIAANRRIEPKKLGSMIRGELDWIVLKAMEKDRGRRYETASKFAEDVQHYLNDEAVVACPQSRAYKIRKFARRNKTALGTAVVVAASLIVGIMGTSWQAYRATRAEALAEQRVEEEQQTRERAETAESAAKQQTEKAESEAAAAGAMFGFLANDLLGLADSDSQAKRGLGPDPDLKVRTLLDRAAKRMEGRFTDQPRAEITLRHAIGSAYLGVDATEEAEKQIRRALELSRAHGWHTTPLLKTLAAVYRHQLRFDEAAELAKEIYEIQCEAHGEDHPETLDAMNKLALVLLGQQKPEEAESLFSRRLEILLRERGENDFNVMKTEHNLAMTYELQGKLNEASELLSRLLERRLQVLPPEHPEIFKNRFALGSVLKKQGHFDKAEQLFRNLANATEHARGDDHYFTLMTEKQLAETLAEQKRFEEALQLAQPLVDTCGQKYGRDDPRTVEFRQSLAAIYSGYAQHQALNPHPENRSQDEVIEFAKTGVALNPESTQHRAILGLVHARFEQWELAADVFDKLAGDQPGRLGPYGFKATVAYWQSGRREQARKQFGVSLRALEGGSFSRDETVGRWKREAEEALSQNAAEAVGGNDTTGEAVDEKLEN